MNKVPSRFKQEEKDKLKELMVVVMRDFVASGTPVDQIKGGVRASYVNQVCDKTLECKLSAKPFLPNYIDNYVPEVKKLLKDEFARKEGAAQETAATIYPQKALDEFMWWVASCCEIRKDKKDSFGQYFNLGELSLDRVVNCAINEKNFRDEDGVRVDFHRKFIEEVFRKEVEKLGYVWNWYGSKSYRKQPTPTLSETKSADVEQETEKVVISNTDEQDKSLLLRLIAGADMSDQQRLRLTQKIMNNL